MSVGVRSNSTKNKKKISQSPKRNDELKKINDQISAKTDEMKKLEGKNFIYSFLQNWLRISNNFMNI